MIYNVANQKNAFSKAEKEQLNQNIKKLKSNDEALDNEVETLKNNKANQSELENLSNRVSGTEQNVISLNNNKADRTELNDKITQTQLTNALNSKANKWDSINGFNAGSSYQLMDTNGKIPNERLNIFNNENKIIEDYIDFSSINNQVATILSDTNLLGTETIILDGTNSTTGQFICPKTGIYKIICVGAGNNAYDDGTNLYIGSSGGVSIQNQLLTQGVSYTVGFNQTIGYMTGTIFQVSSDFKIWAQNGSATSGGEAGILQGDEFIVSDFGKGSTGKVTYQGTSVYYSRGFSGASPVFVAGLMLSDPEPESLVISQTVSGEIIKENVYNAPSICGFGTGGRSSIYTIGGATSGGQGATIAPNDAKPGGIIIIPIAYNN